MFTPDQTKALSAKLDPSHVKTRKQGGSAVSYVEGWQAIAEANRIFGFDGWTREAVELRCVSEKEREIGTGKVPGWGVSYTARVRVVVFAGDTLVTREGCGAGHGIDRDLGQAHESAIKEAETDAMKRALMTFGNPFGLALYDKTQANVGDDDDAPPTKRTKSDTGTEYDPVILAEPEATKLLDAMKENVRGCITLDELEKYIRSDKAKAEYASLPQKHRGYLGQAIQSRKNELQEKAA